MPELIKYRKVSYSSPQEVVIWPDIYKAIYVEDEAADWFSDFLKTPAKLVYFDDKFTRRIDPHYAFNTFSVSFADAFPFLLISEASL